MRFTALVFFFTLILCFQSTTYSSCESGIVRAFSFSYNSLVNEMQNYVESSWSTSTIEVAHRRMYNEIGELLANQISSINLNGRMKAGLILAQRTLLDHGSARSYRSPVLSKAQVATSFLTASGFSSDQARQIVLYFNPPN